MLRRAFAKAAPLVNKAKVAAVAARAFSGHVDVPKDLTEGFPFQVLPYKQATERRFTIGPIVPVKYSDYPIEEDPEKNPAIAFILSNEPEDKSLKAHEKRGLAILFGTMIALGALELFILGGFHPIPDAVYENYAVLDRRDALYGSQHEKTWAELRAEDYA